MHAASRNIRCRNNPLSRQIGWGAIYGAINQVSWLPRSILPSQVSNTESHWQFSRLRLDIASTDNIKLNSSLLYQWRDIMFLNEFMGNIQ